MKFKPIVQGIAAFALARCSLKQRPWTNFAMIHYRDKPNEVEDCVKFFWTNYQEYHTNKEQEIWRTNPIVKKYKTENFHNVVDVACPRFLNISIQEAGACSALCESSPE